MPSRIIITASSPNRGKQLFRALRPLQLQIDLIVGNEQPAAGDDRHPAWDDCRLLVIDLGSELIDQKAFLDRVPRATHVVAMLPQPFAVRDVVQQMQDARVNHLLSGPNQFWHLRHVGLKLATGNLFGLDRFLPSEWEVGYRRIATHDDRCRNVARVAELAKCCGFGPQRRQACSQVADALLVNAMYEAPVDEQGKRVFTGDAQSYQQQTSPQKVSLRFTSFCGQFYISVRDRFGTLRRENLIDGLARGMAAPESQSVAGHGNLGLHLAASHGTWMMINALPGRISEIICMLSPSVKRAALEVFSFATHPEPSAIDAEDEEEEDEQLSNLSDFWVG